MHNQQVTNNECWIVGLHCRRGTLQNSLPLQEHQKPS